jgi:hypothetical protein
MSSKMKGLLKSKTTLYVVAFLSVTNVLSYLMNGNWNAVVMFAIVGLVATYFTKNMIIVLASALLLTNGLISLNYLNDVREGLENKDDKKEEDENNKKHENKKKDTSNDEDAESKKSEIDYATTISEAYDNLDKLIGKDGVKNMAEHTAELAEKQKQLMKNLENMQPIMKQAGEMLKNLNLGDDKLKNIFGGMANQLSGAPIH